jgi:hypothetical protein
MTQDKARKSAIRQRMAATGEPYSVASHAVRDTRDAAEEPDSTPRDDADPGRAERARRLAERARAVAEQAEIRAERADEAASAAESAADMTQEAADLTREWGSAEEIARAQQRAYEARAAAEQTRDRAEQAIELAGEAAVAAEQAEEAADRAEELAGAFDEGRDEEFGQDVDEDSDEDLAGDFSEEPPGRGFRPPTPPRPPRPPHAQHHHREPWSAPQQRDPADRLEERVEEFIRRFEFVRERAGRLISAAERIFPAAQTETTHKEPGAESSAGPD